jgi:BlaI family transcriptional regulator, penicillinase repressor
MKELTRAEEQVMQELWKLEKAFVKELIEQMPEPKPAYNTVSTIVRILEEKSFVAHEALGKSHRYYPTVTKEEYSRFTAGNLLGKYFDGSVKELLSFFVKDKQVDLKQLDQMLSQIKDENKKS